MIPRLVPLRVASSWRLWVAVHLAAAISSTWSHLFVCYYSDRRGAARTEAYTILGAIEMFRTVERGRCPRSIAMLVRAGKLPREPLDPWGARYLLSCSQDMPLEVRSAGPDGAFFTNDDLTASAS